MQPLALDVRPGRARARPVSLSDLIKAVFSRAFGMNKAKEDGAAEEKEKGKPDEVGFFIIDWVSITRES